MSSRQSGYQWHRFCRLTLFVITGVCLIGIVACSGTASREKLAGKVLETLLNDDWEGYHNLSITSADLKRIEKRVKEASDYKDADQAEKERMIECLRIVGGRVIAASTDTTATARRHFDDIVAKARLVYGIDKGQVKLIGIQEDLEYRLSNIHGFSVFNILFSHEAKRYRIETSGIMEVDGSWKLVDNHVGLVEMGGK